MSERRAVRLDAARSTLSQDSHGNPLNKTNQQNAHAEEIPGPTSTVVIDGKTWVKRGSKLGDWTIQEGGGERPPTPEEGGSDDAATSRGELLLQLKELKRLIKTISPAKSRDKQR